MLTQKQIDCINAEYQKNQNIAETARRVGVAQNTVKRYLNEESLRLFKQKEEDREALYYYLIRLFGIYKPEEPVSAANWAQINRMDKQGISFRTQYLTLKYYYEITHHPVQKEHKTVGIIPYILEEARGYFKEQERQKQKLEQELTQQLAQGRIVIPYKPRRGK